MYKKPLDARIKGEKVTDEAGVLEFVVPENRKL